MGVGDRLIEAIKLKGYRSAAEFARAAGVSEVTLRQQINRQSIPMSAADAYSRKLSVSIEWLLYGRKGDKRSASSESNSTDISIPVYSTPLPYGTPKEPIPSNIEPIYPFNVSRAWISKLSISSFDRLFFWRHSGNSMEPTLYTGDLVLIDLSLNKFEGDGIYLVRAGDLMQIKRIILDSTGQFIVRGDNPSYEPMRTTKKKLEILGKRVAMLTGKDS